MDEDAEIANLPRGFALTRPDELQSIRVRAPDGVSLSAQSWGDPSRPAILLIHGFGQCHLSWLPVVRSSLTRSFHLVTYDLRGHGASDKPAEAERYAANRIWADDLACVLDATGVEKALIVGWSLGGRIAIDYAAEHGTGRVLGLNLVGSNLSDRPGLRGTGSAKLRPLLRSQDLARSIAATREFLRRCFFVQPDELTFQEMLAYNMLVPPEVRHMVLGRPAHAEEELRGIRVPVLVTIGDKDGLASLEGARYAASVFPHGKLSIYPDVGHSPFFEAADRFNGELADFARETLVAQARTKWGDAHHEPA
jgi:non-heme chloroperoxidase